jgi:hypothetical protein
MSPATLAFEFFPDGQYAVASAETRLIDLCGVLLSPTASDDDRAGLRALSGLALGVRGASWPADGATATLASLLSKASPGILLNEHFEHDGPTVFPHACKLGLEGIVSKRKDSPYRSGRTPDWLKCKNPDSPAVAREAEEDWGRRR